MRLSRPRSPKAASTLVAASMITGILLASAPARAEDATELLTQARAAFKSRHLLANAKKAVDLYEKAIAANAGYDALWEGARACFYLGEFPMKNNSRSARLAIFDKGINWAKQARQQRPNGVEGVFWHGSMIGVWATARGVLKSLRLSSDVRDAGEQAMKLDPNVECGGAHRLLGRYYHKLPAAFGGDNQKSLQILEKGLSLCPRNDLGRLYLAEVLHDLDRDAEARAHLEKIIAGPPDPRWRAEYRFVSKQAKAFLD
jgi:tetratricopeptide (TPR) repeat protein